MANAYYVSFYANGRPRLLVSDAVAPILDAQKRALAMGFTDAANFRIAQGKEVPKKAQDQKVQQTLYQVGKSQIQAIETKKKEVAQKRAQAEQPIGNALLEAVKRLTEPNYKYTESLGGIPVIGPALVRSIKKFPIPTIAPAIEALLRSFGLISEPLSGVLKVSREDMDLPTKQRITSALRVIGRPESAVVTQLPKSLESLGIPKTPAFIAGLLAEIIVPGGGEAVALSKGSKIIKGVQGAKGLKLGLTVSDIAKDAKLYSSVEEWLSSGIIGKSFRSKLGKDFDILGIPKLKKELLVGGTPAEDFFKQVKSGINLEGGAKLLPSPREEGVSNIAEEVSKKIQGEEGGLSELPAEIRKSIEHEAGVSPSAIRSGVTPGMRKVFDQINRGIDSGKIGDVGDLMRTTKGSEAIGYAQEIMTGGKLGTGVTDEDAFNFIKTFPRPGGARIPKYATPKYEDAVKSSRNTGVPYGGPGIKQVTPKFEKAGAATVDEIEQLRLSREAQEAVSGRIPEPDQGGVPRGGKSRLPVEKNLPLEGLENPNVTVTTPSGVRTIVGKTGITIDKEVVGGINKWGDISPLQGQRFTLGRVIDTVLGKVPEMRGTVKTYLLDPLRELNFRMVNIAGESVVRLKNVVLDPLGIHKSSWLGRIRAKITGIPELSAAVQMYGEKVLSIEKLKKLFPKKWEAIIEADEWFRGEYNLLLNKVNTARLRAGLDAIPKRPDYYRHFNDLTFYDLFSGKIHIIPTNMVGVLDFTRPRAPFFSAALPRIGDKTTYDAVGGFLSYVSASTMHANMIDAIDIVRVFKEAVAETTKESKHLNNFIKYLTEYADSLAMKPHKFDTAIRELGFRVFSRDVDIPNILDAMASRTGANIILGNASSAAMNLLPLAQLVISNPRRFFPSLFNTIKVGVGGAIDDIYSKSRFYKVRYAGEATVDPTTFEKARDATAWGFLTVDKFTVRTLLDAHHEMALTRGLTGSDAWRFADEAVSDMVGDRSIIGTPLMFRSKVGRLGLQFQLEINNLVDYNGDILKRRGVVFGDMTKAQSRAKLAELFVASYVANSIYEQINGRRPLPDPIQMTIDIVNDPDITEGDNFKDVLTRIIGRITGEILSNIPAGPTIGMALGDRPFGMSREEFFGRTEAGRFGTPAVLTALQNVAKGDFSTLLPPFGGTQLKRTLGSIKNVSEGVKRSAGGGLNFPVEPGGVLGTVKTLLMGPYSLQVGRVYSNLASTGMKQLSAAQETELAQLIANNPGVSKTTAWAFYITQRVITSAMTGATKINNKVEDGSITLEDGKREVDAIRRTMKKRLGFIEPLIGRDQIDKLLKEMTK